MEQIIKGVPVDMEKVKRLVSLEFMTVSTTTLAKVFEDSKKHVTAQLDLLVKSRSASDVYARRLMAVQVIAAKLVVVQSEDGKYQIGERRYPIFSVGQVPPTILIDDPTDEELAAVALAKFKIRAIATVMNNQPV